jgi:hypothetical protein
MYQIRPGCLIRHEGRALQFNAAHADGKAQGKSNPSILAGAPCDRPPKRRSLNRHVAASGTASSRRPGLRHATPDLIPAKPGQSHPKATPKPSTSHLLWSTEPPQATSRLPQGHPKATSRLPQGYPKATPRLPQGYLKATSRLPQGSYKASTKPPQDRENTRIMRFGG